MCYCFIGFPLSGKSTLAKKLAEDLGIERVSTGDIARSLGMGLEDSIKTNDLSNVHDEEITRQALEAASVGKILDGFPRSLSQVEKLQGLNIEYKIIFVTENPMIIFDRINERAKLVGRPEDKPDVVSGRLKASLKFLREIMYDIRSNNKPLLIFPSRLGYIELKRMLGL